MTSRRADLAVAPERGTPPRRRLNLASGAPPSLVVGSADAGPDGLPCWPVGGDQCAAAGRPGMGKFEPGERGIVGEQSLAAAARDDRADHQGELIEHPLLDKRSDQ